MKKGTTNTDNNTFAFYSRLLKEPFDTIEELVEAEEAYYAKQKAKEDKIAAKKADAQKVEVAYKELNVANDAYTEKLNALTAEYRDNLAKLKELFEKEKAELKEELTAYEKAYAEELKAYSEKYPKGYELKLKDGNRETTINCSSKVPEGCMRTADLFDLLFGSL